MVRPPEPAEAPESSAVQLCPLVLHTLRMDFSFLQSGRSARLGFCATELYKAAVGGPTLPAIKSRLLARTIEPVKNLKLTLDNS